MDDNNTNQSADDALKPTDGVFNATVDEPKLPEDGGTAATPPTDVSGGSQVPVDHPVTDSGVDQEEQYNEGQGAATGAGDSGQGSDDTEPPVQPQP